MAIGNGHAFTANQRKMRGIPEAPRPDKNAHAAILQIQLG